MRSNIIGREKECGKLQSCLDSTASQLIIVYGRRRVGKTFLINQFFEDNFSFKVTGIFGKSKEMQLQTFAASLTNSSALILKISELYLFIYIHLLARAACV